LDRESFIRDVSCAIDYVRDSCVAIASFCHVRQTDKQTGEAQTLESFVIPIRTSVMEEIAKLNAREMGLDATVESLKDLLVSQFRLSKDTATIRSQDPLFSVGVGLSSLEGLELLAALEKRYGVQIKDLDFWIEESPTLEAVARYLIEHSPAE